MAQTPLSPTRNPFTGIAGRTGVLLTLLAAAVFASILDAVVAVIAHGAGVSHDFRPLDVPSYVSSTFIGIAIGAAGWSLVRSRSNDPATTLRRLVPAVVALSFIPDISTGLAKDMAHTSWGGVAPLMVMHLVVAAVAVSAYMAAMPVGGAAPAESPAGTPPAGRSASAVRVD